MTEQLPDIVFVRFDEVVVVVVLVFALNLLVNLLFLRWRRTNPALSQRETDLGNQLEIGIQLGEIRRLLEVNLAVSMETASDQGKERLRSELDRLGVPRRPQA